MPMPLISPTSGRMIGSAYGAKIRTTRCATSSTIPNSAGSTQKSPVTARKNPASFAAEYATSTSMTAASSPSSALRRVGMRRPALSAGGAGSGGTSAVDTAMFLSIPILLLALSASRRYGQRPGPGQAWRHFACAVPGDGLADPDGVAELEALPAGCGEGGPPGG